jgi:hypothetical protein
MAERTVNDRQLEVLKWIVAGCPSRDWPDETHKTSAVALKNRGLATVSRKSGTWTAEATDAGRYFAEHLAFPEGHWPDRESKPQTSAPPRMVPKRPEPKVTGLRPVDQMLRDVNEAMADPDGIGGLAIGSHDRSRYSMLMASAMRYGKVPATQHLVFANYKVERNGYTFRESMIQLVDKPEWMVVDLEPIAVPSRLGSSTHPVVNALATSDRLGMKKAVRQRALRLLDALAREAESRDYKVSAPRPEPGYTYAKGLLRIEVQGHSYDLTIHELMDKVPHVPTATELRNQERYSWTRIPTNDDVPSGRLRLSILGWSNYPDKFDDTKTITLDSRLPKILQSIELRAAAAEEARLERKRQEKKQRRLWKRAKKRAVTAHREHHRGEVLLRQLEDWEQAKRLDAYIAAMHASIAGLDPADADNASEWIEWARTYRDSRDPLHRPLKVPETPRPRPDDLQPFMQGFNAWHPPHWSGY